MTLQVTSEQIKNLLIDPMGTWYFGKALFHKDYYDTDKTNIGYDMNNICEIYLKLERECKKRFWIEDTGNSNLYYYYKLISLSKFIWPDLSTHDINEKDKQGSLDRKLNNLFSIPRDKLDIFCEIITDSLNGKEFGN